jgi:hypothetical protein
MLSVNTANRVRQKSTRLQLKVARPLIRKITREKNRFIDEAIASYMRLGIITDELEMKHGFNLSRILSFYYEKMIRLQADDTVHFLKRRRRKKSFMFHVKQDENEMLFSFLTDKWKKENLFTDVGTISSTTRKNVERRFMKGFAEGQSIQAIAKSMSSPVKGVKALSFFEAERIAHTEMGKASSFASNETALDVQRTTGNKILKRWLPTPDARTRSHHAAMSGSDWIALDQSFDVGGEFLRYPKDPMGSPGNIIRCRCEAIQEEAKHI